MLQAPHKHRTQGVGLACSLQLGKLKHAKRPYEALAAPSPPPELGDLAWGCFIFYPVLLDRILPHLPQLPQLGPEHQVFGAPDLNMCH